MNPDFATSGLVQQELQSQGGELDYGKMAHMKRPLD